MGDNFINAVSLKENYEEYRVLKWFLIVSNIMPLILFNYILFLELDNKIMNIC